MGSLAGYKYLKTFQLATVIHDLNGQFCDKYISKNSRTHDQMIQAGRSGKQNIAEGYEDFSRQNKIPIWPKERAIREIREIRVIWANISPDNPYIPSLPNNLEKAVNLLITLLNQENYLLDRQIASLEEKFIREGGYSEKLFKKRLKRKNYA